MRRWVETYPERLDYELAELERRGLAFTLDDTRLRETGTVVLQGALPHLGGEIELQVVFPDSYPFMRPEVFAPGLALERHQHPLQHNLCLLERSSRAWRVSDSAAWLISERVPHLLALLAAGGKELREGEAPQGEPWSAYVGTEPGAAVFVSQEMLEIPTEHRLGLLQLQTGAREPATRPLRAALSKVSVRTHGGKRRTLAELTGPLADRFEGVLIEGRWARLDRVPLITRPLDLLDAIVAAAPELEQPRWQDLPDGTALALLGAVASEEVRQGEWQDTWLFVVWTRTRTKGKPQETRYLAPTERLTDADLQARLPESARLAEATVSLAGLGSLGAPLALELARTQVGELRILDCDRVESGNLARWTHGVSAIAHRKTDVIGGWLRGEYPFTRVLSFDMRIGAVEAPTAKSPKHSEAALLDAFLNDTDLLVDATGELGVQHLLSTIAQEKRVPQVFAWGTEGGYGGAVAAIAPGRGGCWMCLQLAFEDGSIALPTAMDGPALQPRGCTDPTFTAAGFALTPIVAQAARVACRLAHHRGESEVHVCELHDGDRELPAPRWVSSPIPIHERCPCECHLVGV